jgi:hypothetical protein
MQVVSLTSPQSPVRENIPLAEYIQGTFVPLSHIAHDWEFHSAVPLTPAEERTIVREPVQAVPAAIARRVGKLRVLIVPFIGCLESGDAVCRAKPEGESHTAAWVKTGDRTHLLLAGRELDPHDTGFELLASIAELARPQLSFGELERYTEVLEEELQQHIQGEIDEDALAAKHALLTIRHWRRNRAQFEIYRNISLVSTMAEYIHGLWHDVQIRVGPEHLPLKQLRRRLKLMGELFPPNPGYQVFAEELEKDGNEE